MMMCWRPTRRESIAAPLEREGAGHDLQSFKEAYSDYFLLIFIALWLQPWTPLLPPLAPVFAVARSSILVCLMYSSYSSL